METDQSNRGVTQCPDKLRALAESRFSKWQQKESEKARRKQKKLGTPNLSPEELANQRREDLIRRLTREVRKRCAISLRVSREKICPELLSVGELDQLKKKMEGWVDFGISGLQQRNSNEFFAAGTVSPASAEAAQNWAAFDVRAQVTSAINAEIDALRAEGEALQIERDITVTDFNKVENGAARSAHTPKDGKGGGAGTWEEIEVSFLSDHRVQIRNGTANETYNYNELGFADRRNEKPSQAWYTLRKIATASGVIKHASGYGIAWTKVEKRVQEIRKVLRAHFRIASDPIPFVPSVGYQARFKISCNPSFDT